MNESHPSPPDATALLRRYQQAMLAFDADALADLYAPDAVHEFPFMAPGHPPRYEDREALRAAYRRIWAGRRAELTDLRDVALHRGPGGDTVVSEWTARAVPHQGTPFDLSGVLVVTARDGRIVHVRDYMDAMGLALATGRLAQVAAQLVDGGP